MTIKGLRGQVSIKSKEELSMHSDNEFQASHTSFDFSKYEKPYEITHSKIIEELIPCGHEKLAVDIGCGPGYFCKLLSTKGWKAIAIDTDSKNLENARSYVVETHLGDAIDVLSKLPDNQYGLALALEIIEHMPKTYGEALLRNAIRVLKPGGKLIISTPNKFSPEGLGGYYWGEKIRGGGKWYAWDGTHVHIYSSKEILRLLKVCGFAVDRIIGYYYEGRLPVIGRWRLPFVKSTLFPLNRIGFNIILECHRE